MHDDNVQSCFFKFSSNSTNKNAFAHFPFLKHPKLSFTYAVDPYFVILLFASNSNLMNHMFYVPLQATKSVNELSES